MSISALSLILAHTVATLGMVTVIWFVQLVHYPLFAQVGEDAFVAYEKAHQLRISFIVIPLMLVELATAGILLWWGIDGIPRTWLVAGAVLLFLVWGSTFMVQVPLHEKLGGGHDPGAIALLVQTNWVRTIGWTLRGVLVIVILARLLVRSGEATLPLA